jgi:exopolysaccharide biosynthesis polyprenyl glycosylphosphotransferase
MILIRREFLLNALKLFDLALMVGSFLLTTLLILRKSAAMPFSDFFSMRIKVGNFVLFFALLVLWHVIFSSFGLYNSRRMSGRRRDAIETFKATTVGTFLICVAALAFRIRMVSPSFLLVFWATATAVAVTQRLLLRSVLERIRLRGRNLRNMLIVGTNSRALDFASRIEGSPELGYRILGFVDQEWTGLENLNSRGYLLSNPTRLMFAHNFIVSDLDHLPRFLRRNVVDEVVIALPFGSLHSQAARIAVLCEEQGITTRVLSNIFDLKVPHARAEEFEATSLITNHTGIAEGWPVLVKRGLDIVLSAILLVMLAPLMLLVAALIKFTSPGPVLFTQNRVGYNKRIFKIYKFRTMTPGAEQRIKELEHLNEVSGPVFKIKNDPRITSIGKLLRQTSIDELPQLFNVLIGDMSLVGPRPLPERDYQGFNQDWQRRRFSVRPGITCLWQVAGRSSITFDKWMQLDLQYIDTWSLSRDLEILLRTIPAVLKGSGAA